VFTLLVVLVKLYLPSDWLERLLLESLTVVMSHLDKAHAEECLSFSKLIVLFHCLVIIVPRPCVIYFMLL